MRLQPGSQLGPYQILGPLGSGGMGEVYRARDTKLSRDVALKVLPESVGQDPDRMARFTREAQLLASVNHPNIAAIYGVEEAGSGRALVLEYIDGETLAERIDKGRIPLGEALRIALQISKALEAAHERNVIHRDLKPANIKITSEGTVKVLDFGLAKVLQDEPSALSASLSNSPTISVAATGAGIILGTAGYMAPEQARGKAVDRRADIWAFGVVLFEMLSARRVFEGETVTDTLAKLLEREPDWNQLPPRMPATLLRLLQRCLTKNPKDRLQAIGEARVLIEELIANPDAASADAVVAVYPLWKKLLPWAAAPVFLAAGFFLKPSAESPDRPVSQFEFALPSVLAHNYRHGVELSPDGRRIAYMARENNSGPRRIYIRSLDQWSAAAIPGTEGALNLSFSPDGQWLAYQQGLQIRKVTLAGGTPAVVAEKLNIPGADWGPPGISWGKNGSIVFPNALGVGLSIVRDAGGQPEEFTTLDAAANETSHRLPHFLPDGTAVLFTVLRFTNITPDWKRAQVWVKPLNGERKLLIEDALDARYAGNGTLVFARQGKLLAVRFDPATLSVSGTPVQVLDGVTQALYGATGVTWSGAAQFSIAGDGTLLYAPGSTEPPQLAVPVWVDRSGKETPITGMRAMSRFAPRVAPDGKRIAFSENHINKDIWIFDTSRATEDRATYEGQNAFPIWLPDGSGMAFRSDRAGPLRIYQSKGSNSRDVVELTMGPQDVPSSWTPDGKELAFARGFAQIAGGNTDIYVVSVDQPGNARAIVATNASETFPEFSPDGKWLAYISNETGRTQLYVQPYPGPGNRVTITGDGNATEPVWSKNSNELFYRFGPNIMSVRYKTSGAEFIPEKPVKVIEQPPLVGGTSVRASYDVAPDGRFLVMKAVSENVDQRNRSIFPSSLRLVVNWTAEIQKLLASQ